MRIHYSNTLKQRSRQLRNNSTLSEILMWNQLKGKKVRGCQFMRQKPIGQYIVDFYCSKLRLVIEIDGESHAGRERYDAERSEYLESLGLTVLRFADGDVKRNMEGIVRVLHDYIDRRVGTNTTP